MSWSKSEILKPFITLSNPKEKKQTQKDIQDKIAHVVEEVKKT